MSESVQRVSFDWLIIGGGIHGVHIAARLLREANVAPERLGIVDPNERLLERWHTSTETTGMTYLRSPSVHHLDLNPYDLQLFANRWKGKKRGLFAHPYGRPALSLFNAHCDQVIETLGLSNLHIQSRALVCAVDAGGAGVQLTCGRELAAHNVVLALGAGEQPEWPDWAPRRHARVHHVFESGFDGWPSMAETVVVVGGGISGAQVALRLFNTGHQVHLVSRHALRQNLFDTDPGWVGPKFMRGFSCERDVERRRSLITQARHKGSVPPDVHRALQQAITSDRLHLHEAEIERLDVRDDGVEVRLSTGAGLEAHRVLLATGFAAHRPGGSLVDELIASASLSCAPCGYPIVDSALRWHPHIRVSGPLAELELGPVSRNIVGARRARGL